jgi:hypothetical protein
METEDDGPPLQDAAVARAPDPAGGRASATLAPKVMAFLAVSARFHGRPVGGLEARFFRAQPDGSKGEPLGEVVLTDSDGVARLPRLVTIGHYICEFEHQEPVLVSTVLERNNALPLALPIGRSLDEHEGGDDAEAHDTEVA